MSGLSLDESYESQVPTEPETPPAEPETPPAVTEDAEPEGTVEIPTGKVVPLQALQAERQAKKAEREARETLEREVVELRQKSLKLDQIANEWQAVQPLIQQARQQAQAPAQKPAGPLSPDEAAEYAKDLDLYKADGTPDVDRAQRLAARQQALTERSTQAAIAPYQQQSAQQQSAGLFEQAANMKDKTGQAVDRGVLQQIWSMVPPELSAKPEVATILHRVALAEAMIQGKHRGAVQAPPPLQHTEGLGGAPPPAEKITAVDRRFLDASDIKTSDFTKIGERYKPGQNNVLE